MKEAIFILEREKHLLEQCLKQFKEGEYPEAFKQRGIKLKEISNAIDTLKMKQSLIDLTGI